MEDPGLELPSMLCSVNDDLADVSRLLDFFNSLLVAETSFLKHVRHRPECGEALGVLFPLLLPPPLLLLHPLLLLLSQRSNSPVISAVLLVLISDTTQSFQLSSQASGPLLISPIQLSVT